MFRHFFSRILLNFNRFRHKLLTVHKDYNDSLFKNTIVHYVIKDVCEIVVIEVRTILIIKLEHIISSESYAIL